MNVWLSQGRRRLLKSGTAVERHRCSARAECSSGGEYERGSHPLSEAGFGGFPPRIFFEFNMSLEAILMHFETIFACKIRLIVQEFHVAVFRCVSNPHH